MHLLQRNKDALLTGLSRPSSSSSSSNADSAAAAYLWDLRKPKRSAASLDIPAAAAASDAGASCASTKSGGSYSSRWGAGVCSLSVHEDGVLAAAGCRDGTVLVWDMRQVRCSSTVYLTGLACICASAGMRTHGYILALLGQDSMVGLRLP
jgi:WD40 repeat protein